MAMKVMMNLHVVRLYYARAMDPFNYTFPIYSYINVRFRVNSSNKELGKALEAINNFTYTSTYIIH